MRTTLSPMQKLRALGRALATQARRPVTALIRARDGVAAVEFALILPLMLALYFGCAVLAQGLEAGRKVQSLSRTLADLTAQTLPTSSGTGTCASVTTNPCVTDANIQNFLAASTSVMFPFGGTPNMTISEIIFDNNAGGTCCEAKLVWSVRSSASGTLRSCGLFSQSANGTNGATVIPAGLYPSASSATGSFLIVADVNYSYQPSFGFTPYAWGQPANGGAGYPINVTTYMTPRNSSTAPIQWSPDGTISASNKNACSESSPPTSYSLPNYNIP